MDCVIEYNDFLYPDTAFISNPNNVSIITLIRKFDTMRYFREEGSKVFSTICLLARFHFGKLSNAGFQERVFSTAGNVMDYNQTRMSFESLEMRTLLAHNKQLIREGVI